MAVEGILQALDRASEQVGAVTKSEVNQHQHYNFRGIDAVLKAVYPAFRAEGIIVVPTVKEITYEQIEVGAKRSLTGHVMVQVVYTFWHTDGSSLECLVAAEANDSGDKAVTKAMSVAFRTALLQVLCLPTDEPDPDSFTYERSQPVTLPDNIDDLLSKLQTLDNVRAFWQHAHNENWLPLAMPVTPERPQPMTLQEVLTALGNTKKAQTEQESTQPNAETQDPNTQQEPATIQTATEPEVHSEYE